MTDQELLLSISNMMDNKFKAELQPIRNDLQSVKNEVQLIKNELKATNETVANELQTFRNELQATKDSVSNELQTFRNELQATKDSVFNEMQITKDSVSNEMQATKDTLMTELHIVKNDIHHVKLFQENVIMPRLCTIESCYTDTYDRYKNYAEKMDAAFDDIELLKATVAAHSLKLQQLA